MRGAGQTCLRGQPTWSARSLRAGGLLDQHCLQVNGCAFTMPNSAILLHQGYLRLQRSRRPSVLVSPGIVATGNSTNQVVFCLQVILEQVEGAAVLESQVEAAMMAWGAV